jgi:hypothetical protein
MIAHSYHTLLQRAHRYHTLLQRQRRVIRNWAVAGIIRELPVCVQAATWALLPASWRASLHNARALLGDMPLKGQFPMSFARAVLQER